MYEKSKRGLSMQQVSLSLIFLTLFLLPGLPKAAVSAPHEIAGIRLGSDVNGYPDIIHSNFMKEVVVTDWKGFRKGVISYGVCKYKDQVLKIDLKYHDKSEKFYKTLLKKFRRKFGKPDSFEGDSFGVMRIWKWRFVDENGNRISLSLQYNRKNTNETIGNMVKLSMPGKIAEERRCFMQMCDEMTKKRTTSGSSTDQLPDWDNLLPK